MALGVALILAGLVLLLAWLLARQTRAAEGLQAAYTLVRQQLHVQQTERDFLLGALEEQRRLTTQAEHRLRGLQEALRGFLRCHGQPCHFCGEPCDCLTGDPCAWPVLLCHREDPGEPKAHHAGCVRTRLELAARQRQQD